MVDVSVGKSRKKGRSVCRELTPLAVFRQTLCFFADFREPAIWLKHPGRQNVPYCELCGIICYHIGLYNILYMKTKFLVLAILFLPLLLHSQTWSIGTRWVYGQDEYMPNPEEEYRIFTKTADTLIQGNPCSILEETFLSVFNQQFSTPWVLMRYFLWQHGAQIDIFDTDSLRFYPVFDFDKTVGDTLYSHCMYIETLTASVVDSVGTVMFGGSMRRVQWVRSLGNNPCRLEGQLIEGVGGTEYLWARYQFIDPPPGGWLACFRDSLGSFSVGGYCNALVGTRTPSGPRALEISPNPTSGKLFFPQLAEIKEIRVFNACGKLVKTMTAAGEQTVQELPNGPYYLQVTTAGQTLSTKIIKIDP